MGSVPLRISRISENLRVIQNEISLLTGKELPSSRDEASFEESDVRALCDVKLSVDHLRQVLRTYIDFASAQLDDTSSEEFQRVRAERTAQIVRFACLGLQRREGKDHEVPSSLFERLTQMTFATVDRHMSPAGTRPEPDLQAVAD